MMVCLQFDEKYMFVYVYMCVRTYVNHKQNQTPTQKSNASQTINAGAMLYVGG